MSDQRLPRRCAFVQPDDQKQAFTLIELVVVVFTLALLGCIVLPALAAAGDSGKRQVCFNNLKQLGMAAAMYGNDNRDFLAPPNWDGGAANSPPGWLYTVTYPSFPDPGPGGAYASNPLAAYASGLWFQYVRDPKIYLCPVDIESKTYTATNPVVHRTQRLSSYVMNGAVCGFEAFQTGRTCKITDAWSPSCYLLWGPDENSYGPGNPGAFAFNDGSNFPTVGDGIMERLHTLTGGEILTVGGAVQFVSVQKFTTESTAAGKSLAWWSPFSGAGH
jgi:type II secretory pathway pseudopilin PulG